MLLGASDKAIEDAVGVFAMALSFASDGGKEATVLAAFCDFHNLRCYDYRSFQARQWGLSVQDIEKFVYLTSPQVTVFNTPGYLFSQHTVQEFDLIRRSAALQRLVSIELGGHPLPSIGLPIESIQGFSSEVALSIVRPEA
jgi:hypothetical protein